MDKCPVCLSAHCAAPVLVQPTGDDRRRIDCPTCGTFDASKLLFAGPLMASELSPFKRAVLSHWLRRTAGERKSPPFLTKEVFDALLSDPKLPTPSEQVTNAIRFVGDELIRTSAKVRALQPSLYARIGAASPQMAGDIVLQLYQRGTIRGSERTVMGITDILEADLTLDGWALYESERRGKVAGKYGFLAMKFGDAVLDQFVSNVVKPCVSEGIGFRLVDMRDVARAGIIDNLLREQIRDAAFVIVDLTHDNYGAYWEAGYAEGLNKPVIYICERSKFDAKSSHFDTNHCTTVMWDAADYAQFAKELVATLRRSLNLFPS